jgi:hypothetical protein
MILSLLTGAALAQSTVDPLFEQLLGDSAVATTATVSPTSGLILTTPQLVASGVAIILLAILSYWLKQRQKQGPSLRSSLSLNSKLALPGGNTIAIVHIDTANGDTRELLIGLGNGAPTLIKDLGTATRGASPAKRNDPPNFETLLDAQEKGPAVSARAESANAVISDLIASRDEKQSGRSRWV